MEEDEGDPFSCFGSEDDDNVDDGATVLTTASTSTSANPNHKPKPKPASKKRSEDCGVLSYHHGTEAAMLAHVRNAVADLAPPSVTDCLGWKGSAADLASAAVLAAIDEFCQSRHWMMHVGPDKGHILAQKLYNAVKERDLGPRETFVAVELGTYCGYASVLLGRTLREVTERPAESGEGGANLECRLYTVEINPEYFAISRELIRLSLLDETVVLVEIPVEINVMETEDAAADIVSSQIWAAEAKNRQRHNQRGGAISSLPQIDFLFIDHDKDAYLTDLKRLERERLVRAGSIVVADNVLFARIDDYREYVQNLAKQGIVTTETIMSQIEYADEEQLGDDGHHGDSNNDGDNKTDGEEDHRSSSHLFRDGIEITHYKRNPQSDKEEGWTEARLDSQQ